jgi:hypothetical protein
MRQRLIAAAIELFLRFSRNDEEKVDAAMTRFAAEIWSVPKN